MQLYLELFYTIEKTLDVGVILSLLIGSYFNLILLTWRQHVHVKEQGVDTSQAAQGPQGNSFKNLLAGV